MNDEDALVVAGTSYETANGMRTPCMLLIDSLDEIAWMRFLPSEYTYATTEMSISRTPANRYQLLLNSKLPAETAYSIHVSEIDPTGVVMENQRWSDATKNFISSSSTQLPDGDFLVLSEDQQNSFESNPLVVSKISTNEELLWSKTIAGSEVSISRQLAYFPEDESVIVLGEYGAVWNSKIQLYKLDWEGNVVWEQSLLSSGTFWPGASYVVRVAIDHVMVTFSKSSNIVTVMQVDLDGNVQWEMNYEGSKSEVSRGIIQTQDGNYVMLTNTGSYGNGEFDVLLTKITPNGVIIWQKLYGGSASDQATKLIERRNGDLVVVGNTNEGTSSSSRYKLFVLKTDSEGNPKG